MAVQTPLPQFSKRAEAKSVNTRNGAKNQRPSRAAMCGNEDDEHRVQMRTEGSLFDRGHMVEVMAGWYHAPHASLTVHNLIERVRVIVVKRVRIPRCSACQRWISCTLLQGKVHPHITRAGDAERCEIPA
jgi:hypothetical protein